MNKKKIVVAITGASGSIYAKLLLDKFKVLSEQIEKYHLVWSSNAQTVWEHELGNKEFETYQSLSFDNQNFLAPFASGSAQYETMIIIPCSMGTLGRIANGISNDLITRAADVILKERRKLICVVREMPYNLIHIRNMENLTLAGGIICPATPSFYHQPQDLESCLQSVVDRTLQLAGLNTKRYRWQE